MTIAIKAALGATILLAVPASAAEAEAIRYRVTLDVAGSWSESVRANPDAYPPAQVATRDSDLPRPARLDHREHPRARTACVSRPAFPSRKTPGRERTVSVRLETAADRTRRPRSPRDHC